MIVLTWGQVSYSENPATGKTILTGKITDSKTGSPIPGVSIYLPDIKTGTTSLADGTYKIENLPKSKVLIQVSYIGYKLIAEMIDLNVISHKDFEMEVAITELNEVVVTGLSKSSQRNRTPAPIAIMSNLQLQQNTATNIIDAIATQPGISQITTGPGISKPVIRGLGYNRIITLDDGIRQEGQQWGDEHGIEIDEASVYKVEILKGPASLTYGSDALAGVINFISAPTLPDGQIDGKLSTEYQTNNGLFGLSADVAGNKHGFIFDVRYSDKLAHAYQNKYDGYVLNSGFRENTAKAILGLNKSWGYSHLDLSFYNLNPGIVEGERDSITGKFVKPINMNGEEGQAIATHADFTSYKPLTPYQEVNHYKAVLNNSFILGNSTLKATFGWQQNRRKEFGDILNPNQYGLYFYMNTLNYDLKYLLPEHDGFSLSFGINGMQQSSQNKGTEFLVPAYKLFDAGLFTLAKKSYAKLEISGGIRYDVRFEKGNDLYLDAEGLPVTGNAGDAQHRFTAFNSTFSGVSGSLGATYQFSKSVYTKFNISRGFRAPNIGEIGSNGVHEGTLRYELGNPGLKAENSLQLDYSLGFNTEHVSADLDLFTNQISNYIFLSKLQGKSGADSIVGGYDVFKYNAGNASLSGGEFTIDIHPHPLDWLHFENTFSYVSSILKGQPDSSKYLPLTPPARYTSELKATSAKLGKNFSNAFVKIGLASYFRQNHVYSAFGTETATPGYTLLNFGMGTDVRLRNKQLFTININAENLLDVAYQSHLSRLKYAPENYASGRSGVFDMGRNVTFKVIIPIGITGMNQQ